MWNADAPDKAVRDLMEMLQKNNPVHVFMTSCYDQERQLILTFSPYHPSRTQYVHSKPMKVTADDERADEENKLTLLQMHYQILNYF